MVGAFHHLELPPQFHAFQAVFTAREALVPLWDGTQEILLLILVGHDLGLPGDVRPAPKRAGQTHSKPDCYGKWPLALAGGITIA